MASSFGDVVLDFDLDFLHQTNNASVVSIGYMIFTIFVFKSFLVVYGSDIIDNKNNTLIIYQLCSVGYLGCCY